MDHSTAPPADGAEAGEGGSPFLTLNGFTGPLDHLLTLARAQKIDIADISLTALIDQLTTALHHAPAATSLGEKGDWVVMAAWLVQLRTRLLLPADAPGQQAATAEADQLRGRLVALEEVQALAVVAGAAAATGSRRVRSRAPRDIRSCGRGRAGDRRDGIPLGQPGAVRRRSTAGHGNGLSSRIRCGFTPWPRPARASCGGCKNNPRASHSISSCLTSP